MHSLSLHIPRIVFLLYFSYNRLTSLLLVFEQKHRLMDFLELYSASTSSGDFAWSLPHAQEVMQVEDDFFYSASTFLVGVITWSVLSDTATQVMNWPCFLLDNCYLLGHLLLLQDTTSFPHYVPGYIYIKVLPKSFLTWIDSLLYGDKRILCSQAAAIYQCFSMCVL